MYAVIQKSNKGIEGLKIKVLEEDFTDIQQAEQARVDFISQGYKPQDLQVVSY